MSDRPHEYTEYAIEERDVDARDARWLGTVSGQGGQVLPSFYDPEEGTIFHGTVDEENERIVPDADSVRSVEEPLGEAIEEVGEELGWESLSEFAREHLEEGAGEGEGEGEERD